MSTISNRFILYLERSQPENLYSWKPDAEKWMKKHFMYLTFSTILNKHECIFNNLICIKKTFYFTNNKNFKYTVENWCIENTVNKYLAKNVQKINNINSDDGWA